jgi:hypothetical protein
MGFYKHFKDRNGVEHFVRIQERTVFLIGVPDRLNNSWHCLSGGSTHDEAKKKFEAKINSEPVLKALRDHYGIHMMTLIQQYRPNDGWHDVKSWDGWGQNE